MKKQTEESLQRRKEVAHRLYKEYYGTKRKKEDDETENEGVKKSNENE